MGCPFSKSKTQKRPQLSSEDSIELTPVVPEYPVPPVPTPVPKNPGRPIPPPQPNEKLLPDSLPNQRCIQLHTPIYVGNKTYTATDARHVSFEKGDEMEFISKGDDSELCVNHLRTGKRGFVKEDHVRLDTDTPLRLAVKDSGIIQKCLIQHNILGAYLIRRSGSVANGFVLSIAQPNKQYNTFYWHYLISIHRSTRKFYFTHEDKLKHLQFSSFKQLISNQDVLQHIPLSDILPYFVEFEEDVWKIPFDQISISQKIGEGNFGEVYRATWHRKQQTITLAAKKLRIHQITRAIEREVEAMKSLNNLHIVSLYGVSEDPIKNEIYILTELLESGDLKSWLKKADCLPARSTLFGFARDIASGMYYLEFRNYVHRDLACRNILLDSNLKSVKIADFGLSIMLNEAEHHRSQEAQNEKIPLRWTAPEILADRSQYSIKSDVWSYGILLIEMWLKGEDPYKNQLVAWIDSAVQGGHVHEKPDDCPDDFYEKIIRRCLIFQAKDRPSFSDIVHSLKTQLA